MPDDVQALTTTLLRMKPVEMDAILKVLARLGYKPTVGNYKLLDPIIDWAATAKLMDQPIRTALCHILDGIGRIVQDDGKPVVVARDVEASTEAEAVEILSRSSHVFVKWWPSDSSEPGVYDGDNQREIHDTADGNNGMECHPKTAKCLWNDSSGHIRRERPETPSSAVRWLRKKLMPGCRLQKTLKAEAASDGFSLRELAAAKHALSVKVEPCGYGADWEQDPNDETKRRKVPDMVFWSLPRPFYISGLLGRTTNATTEESRNSEQISSSD